MNNEGHEARSLRASVVRVSVPRWFPTDFTNRHNGYNGYNRYVWRRNNELIYSSLQSSKIAVVAL